jgi:CHRD domain
MSRSTRRATAVLVVAIAVAVGAWGAGGVSAQGADKFAARLGWVPTAGVDRVSGKGSATATLSGTSLALAGSFEGLGGPATIARLHQGIAKGARGKAIADVKVPIATSGTFAATVTLTGEQVDALKQGRLYLQLHGDKGLAPDGANLWGWFLR